MDYKYLLSLSILLTTACVSHSQTSLTKSMEACLKPDSHINKNQYNECILAQVKKIQPLLSKGVPELGIPPLDPLVIANIQLNKAEPPVTLNSVFKNVRISGIKDMDMKYVNIDIFGKEKKMSLGLVVPTMLMRGQYDMSGNIFLLPIEGKGNFISKLDTVIVEGSANIIPTGSGIKATTENVNVGFKIKDMAMKMDNLFEGNQVLSDTMHHFLNENGQVILDEIRPELTKSLNGLISGLFTTIFDSTPASLHQHSLGLRGIINTANNRVARPQRTAQQSPQRTG